jgi:hypothetical protein
MRVLCDLVIGLIAFVGLLAFASLPAFAQQFSVEQLKHQPLTNESIVTLAKAGFDELFILQLIRSSRTNFDTSVEGLVKMKQAGVSEDLIRMMAMPSSPVPPSLTPVAAPAPATSAKALNKKKGLLGLLHGK